MNQERLSRMLGAHPFVGKPGGWCERCMRHYTEPIHIDPPAGLKATMTLDELLTAAKASRRYLDDMDFHLLTDWVERLRDAVASAQKDAEEAWANIPFSGFRSGRKP